MSVKIIEKIGDVKIFGNGALGGKGAGLVKINESKIPKTHKLRTRVLTTAFFDRFLKHGKKFEYEELTPIAEILNKLGDIPISVRSSATNEACISPEGEVSVHAGENTSFMLPNNHPNFQIRLEQLKQAIYHIYNDFIHKQAPDCHEKMAIVINPIPGFFDNSAVGPIYYPLISGVANSFFPYALKSQDPDEGFARIACGHGYATVLDDFPVISMATIKRPIPVRFLGEGQMYFYAINMLKNESLAGEELETMKKLHIKFTNLNYSKFLGIDKNRITLESLIQKDRFGFKSSLIEIMEMISSKISSHFQIEFVFNIDLTKTGIEQGIFHVVQLTQLPEQKFETIKIPENAKHTYLSINNLQGHGIKQDIKFAVVVSPFIYTKEKHGAVRNKINLINQKMREQNENYIVIVPGRVGSTNRDWGIQLDFREIDAATAIFEYGVDIAGRPEPLAEPDDLTGGIYGSHFLYMIQGGKNEQEKKLKTRMYGTQGTHFLTNLVSNNIIYGYIMPNHDLLDPWFFSPPGTDDAVYALSFPKAVTIYADSINQHCVVIC